MKKIVLFGLLFSGLLAFLFRQSIQDTFFTPDLPEPTHIAFEKQLPLYSYDWRLIGPTGSVLSFVEYMNRNVIINYWSPNDEASVQELKIWAKLYEDYKNDVFFIFATKDSQVDVNKFLKENNYVFPIFYSGSTPLKSIVLDKAPKTYLVTKSGRIVVNHTGAANWNSEGFRKLLDEVINQNK